VKKHIIALAIIAGATLAGCGGGGGGGSTPSVPIPAPTPARPTLQAAFTGSGPPTHSARRVVRALGIGTALVPTAILDVPDPYTNPAASGRTVTQVFAIAYLTGGTLPSPLPAGAWTQSGVSLATTPFSPSPTFSGMSGVLPDGLAVQNTGSAIGKTIFTDAVVGFGNATVTAESFPSFGLADSGGSYINPQNFAANGLVFTQSDGRSSPASSTASSDLYMIEDGAGHTSVVCPHGCWVGAGTMDAIVGATPATTFPTTSIPTSTFATSSPLVQFPTADGEVVAFVPTGLVDEHNASNTCGVVTGCATHLAGVYIKSKAHAWTLP
jgi:hypothetical protein